MGDIADMMLEGGLCEQCGVVMPDYQEPGYPRSCPDCGGSSPRLDKVNCTVCGKRVKEKGLKDHMRDAHNA
tara:strand:- start:771 stop:983 length:213 start_codon:yes stop_codon:yes gene_type:complete